MNKLRVYQIVALGLLLLNLGLVAFILTRPVGADRAPQRAVERFVLDAEQHEQFLTYARAHERKVADISERQAEMLRTYFLQLTTEHAADPTPLPPDLAALEAEKINSTYRHFLEVRELLRPEQREEFPAFVEAVLEQILVRRGKQPKDRK